MKLNTLLAFLALPMLNACAGEPQDPLWDEMNYTQAPSSADATCGDDISNCTVGGHSHSGGHSGHR